MMVPACFNLYLDVFCTWLFTVGIYYQLEIVTFYIVNVSQSYFDITHKPLILVM